MEVLKKNFTAPLLCFFLNPYQNYNPRKAKKLTTFYKLLKEDTLNKILAPLNETSDSLNEAFNDAYQLAKQQPFP